MHALNIVRLLVRDYIVGGALTPLLPECMRLAVAGFTSPWWAIRNSSTMLCAACIDRGIGAAARNHAHIATGLSADVFWSRFPSLHGFLLLQLRECAAYALAHDGHTHPSLQPPLVLLSRLQHPLNFIR